MVLYRDEQNVNVNYKREKKSHQTSEVLLKTFRENQSVIQWRNDRY